jgi:hypothetical protein
MKSLNIKTLNISKLLHFKIYILVISIFLFSFLYSFLDDSNFSGLNTIQELLKEEIIKQEVGLQIQNKGSLLESMQNLEGLQENKKELNAFTKAAKKVEEDVKKNEIQIDKIKPPFWQKYFNRLYFSVSTGCLLGYGDIYPISNIGKTISMIQSIITIALIVY